jgi:hypothetical protein
VKRRGVYAIVVMLVVAIAFGGALIWGVRHRGPIAPAPVRSVAVAQPERLAPVGTRVRVQVLNGTKTKGLARRATQVLRDHGFDVVETSTDIVARDTTIVYDNSGHAEWAASIAKLFAPARVVPRADTSRYLDITISIGSSWRAPAQPFYP